MVCSLQVIGTMSSDVNATFIDDETNQIVVKSEPLIKT